jgi:hypothetical protein
VIYTNNIPSSRFASNNKINLIVISDYKSIALPTELQGHNEKAYIYSRIESQDSFRHFFYAQNIARIGSIYTHSIPKLPILLKYPEQNDWEIREITPIDFLQHCYRYNITLL